ncbi:MAG: TetR/AcrR family transcriptional regulator [Bowdeniella nasicola]|nr:TetR/AcrR family transcriptional regulator [Bowdeniella nasicola]
MARTRVGRPTGPKPTVNVTEAAKAALRLGVDRFTMSEVAAELGVVPSAMYRHIENREALVHEAVRTACAAMAPTVQGETWQDVLWGMTETMWETFERYPGLAATILTTPGAHVWAHPYIARVIGALRERDFPGDEARAAFAVDIVGDLVIAHSIGIRHLREADVDGVRGVDRARAIFEKLGRADPAAEAAAGGVAAFTPSESWTGREALTLIVEFVLQALDALPPSVPSTHGTLYGRGMSG